MLGKFLLVFPYEWKELKVSKTDFAIICRVFWKHVSGESCLQEDLDKKDKVSQCLTLSRLRMGGGGGDSTHGNFESR